MKRIKSIFLTALCVLAVTAVAQRSGQTTSGDDTSAGQGPGVVSVDDQLKLTEEFGLSAKQRAEIKPILEERNRQILALIRNHSLSPADRRSKERDINRDTYHKLRETLTGDQKRKYDEMRGRKG